MIEAWQLQLHDTNSCVKYAMAVALLTDIERWMCSVASYSTTVEGTEAILFNTIEFPLIWQPFLHVGVINTSYGCAAESWSILPPDVPRTGKQGT